MYVITDHAVERFIERHAPNSKFKSAKRFLEEKVQDASPLKEKTILGDHQWRVDDPYCILVMKRDVRTKDWVCVTVLPEPEGTSIHVSEMDILRDHIYDQLGHDHLDVEAVSKIFATKGPLIGPSTDHKAELSRIAREAKMWHRINDMLTRHLGASRKQQRRTEAEDALQTLLVRCLRFLITGLQYGRTPEDLLKGVELFDKFFLEDAFLRPENFTKAERQEIMEKRQESLVDVA